MKQWYIYAKKAPFNEIAAKYGISPVTARIMRNRDVEGDEQISEYLYGGLNRLHKAAYMKDMDKASNIILQKIEQGRRIRVIGDYDIDGVTSIYILINALKRCGAWVDGRIPHRIKDGYGINEALIKEAYDDGVDTIVTCDNGIAAYAQIEYANSLGMTVVITDHHDIPYNDTDEGRKYIIPPAAAVVNPKQEDCGYPFKGLCGAAVAWKLVSVLYEKKDIQETEWEDYIELVAMATIGDVMDLQGENRIIVKEGLKRIGNTKNLGLRALIAVNQLNPLAVTAYHIGFVIGPCLNAGGRLDTAYMALELLMSETREEAESRAGELKALNESRKDMTKQGVTAATAMIDSTELADDRVLVVYLPECHESLAGIIAGRIREIYYKPVLVITDAEEGLKGSGRSIEAYNMFEELVKVRDCLDKFGGHPMAAGLSFKKERLTELRQRLNDNSTLTDADFVEKIWIDVAMPFGYITEELIEEFKVLEPFGKGNTKPVFAAKNVTVLGYRLLGVNRNVLKMSLKDEAGCVLEGICFNDALKLESKLKNEGNIISILYYPDINEYNGNKSIQIVVTDYK
ncbi:MAG: single-stranded-DNA-specific exonuclease RecJ [Lachnospiraceae bacterium]|nr:single-stranded-DNA-specific exonuclease RecJ [Lachnospiraceae bacterium]